LQALALASLIVETKLPVRLRLLLPIVENSISGEALRPGDVIRARNGKTTEITNTDAEGRLILADALAAAVEAPHRPDVVIDFATLTGAARVALGSDLPAVFSNNLTALERLWRLSSEINDPVWMMPLHEPMRANLKSSIADLVNAAEG
jgi:leucyl aminopeptidase